MASIVDICNIALGHVGDAANVQSIDPPDGSVQADYCHTFYPIARDSLLERHDWSFAMKRTTLALLSVNGGAPQWAYCYAQPDDLLNAIAVLDPTAQDDTSVGLLMSYTGANFETPYPRGGVYTPQPFILESAADGTDVVYTNQPGATMRYVQRITDPTKFSPLFVETLAMALGSLLAGPIVKGLEGARLRAALRNEAFGQNGMSGLFGQAVASDSGNKKSSIRDRQQVTWINAR